MEVEEQLEMIEVKWPQLSNECQNQMPVSNGKKFRYRVGQMVLSDFHWVKIIWRWHGREVNFYDVMLQDGSTWTFDEEELLIYEMTYYV